jgi:hypothetical protein
MWIFITFVCLGFWFCLRAWQIASRHCFTDSAQFYSKDLPKIFESKTSGELQHQRLCLP